MRAERLPRMIERSRLRPWSLPFVLVAIVVHLFTLQVLTSVAPWFAPSAERSAVPVSLVILEPEEEPEPEEIDEPEPDVSGQIVEVAPPELEERPDEAEYLSEYDIAVEEETQAKRFDINPDVLAKQFSEEQKMEMEDLLDMNVDKPSTGATVGNHRFDPNRDGSLAALPSPWTMTNREGTQDPVPSAHMTAAMSGAPQNDRLREKHDNAVNLNTKEYLYAGYLKRIRRLVNFYWKQNLDNLPRSVRTSRPAYTTAVNTILNSDGALEYIAVIAESGSGELDEAVVRAFRLAGPFPNPPEGLIEKDGRVYLPEMDFTVQIGAARAHYQGIDPRAGVQFPGILKSPR